jgi:hypothetical protein
MRPIGASRPVRGPGRCEFALVLATWRVCGKSLYFVKRLHFIKDE